MEILLLWIQTKNLLCRRKIVNRKLLHVNWIWMNFILFFVRYVSVVWHWFCCRLIYADSFNWRNVRLVAEFCYSLIYGISLKVEFRSTNKFFRLYSKSFKLLAFNWKSTRFDLSNQDVIFSRFSFWNVNSNPILYYKFV